MLYAMVHATRRRYEVLSGRRFCKSCTTAGILFPPTTSGHTWRPRSALALDGVSTECDRSAPAMMQSITIMERTRRAGGTGGRYRGLRGESVGDRSNVLSYLICVCGCFGYVRSLAVVPPANHELSFPSSFFRTSTPYQAIPSHASLQPFHLTGLVRRHHCSPCSLPDYCPPSISTFHITSNMHLLAKVTDGPPRKNRPHYRYRTLQGQPRRVTCQTRYHRASVLHSILLSGTHDDWPSCVQDPHILLVGLGAFVPVSE